MKKRNWRGTKVDLAGPPVGPAAPNPPACDKLRTQHQVWVDRGYPRPKPDSSACIRTKKHAGPHLDRFDREWLTGDGLAEGDGSIESLGKAVAAMNAEAADKTHDKTPTKEETALFFMFMGEIGREKADVLIDTYRKATALPTPSWLFPAASGLAAALGYYMMMKKPPEKK
jgi:hypothetical protein